MSTLGTTGPFGMPPLPVRRFSVAEYHRMIDIGLLTENDPVELLEGWIVPKMPHTPSHDGTIHRIAKRVGRRLPPGWDVRVQSAITTSDSEPEPDIAVARGDETSYDVKHPGPADIGMLIEVSATSVAYDRTEKGQIYARANIASYWVVNLVDHWIEAYSDPDRAANPPAFKIRNDYRPGDQIPLVLDGQTVATFPVSDLLP